MRTCDVIKGAKLTKRNGVVVDVTYAVWMQVVNMVLGRQVGCHSAGMVDYHYRDDYDAGVDAEAAAWEGVCVECEAQGMDVQDILPDWKPVNVFVKG